MNCYNPLSGFCFTTDSQKCTQDFYTLDTGSYCWSNDGYTCSSYKKPECGILDGQDCNITNSKK